MKTMNVTPMTIAQYEHDHVDVVAKCKKAISKFINTYLVLVDFARIVFDHITLISTGYQFHCRYGSWSAEYHDIFGHGLNGNSVSKSPYCHNRDSVV